MTVISPWSRPTADATRVVAGDIIELRWPEGYVRGVGYYLSGWNDAEWSLLYELTAALGGDDRPSWASFEDAQAARTSVPSVAWPDVGYIGPEPDLIVIPESAPAGRYRVCEALAGDDPYCAELEVVERP